MKAPTAEEEGYVFLAQGDIFAALEKFSDAVRVFSEKIMHLEEYKKELSEQSAKLGFEIDKNSYVQGGDLIPGPDTQPLREERSFWDKKQFDVEREIQQLKTKVSELTRCNQVLQDYAKIFVQSVENEYLAEWYRLGTPNPTNVFEMRELLLESTEKWNVWRKVHPNVRIDFQGVDFAAATLKDADLTDVYLHGANLIRANLQNATLTGITTEGWVIDHWIIKNVTCEYIYLDNKKEKRFPQGRDFGKGEFESLFNNYTGWQLPLDDNHKFQVFLSYARENFDDAKKLYDDLSSHGIKIWFDAEQLVPGQNWKLTINNAIKECSYFLALLSTHSVSKKGYVQKELKIALDILEEYPASDIFVIPIRLDECKPIDGKLQNLHWVDLFLSYEKGLSKLLQVLMPTKKDQK